MSIDFSFDRWEKIKEDARLWWSGELDRPLIQLVIWGRDPGRPEPKVPPISRAVAYDLSVSPEDIVDRWDYDLSRQKFMGDAFPQQWMDFGPGVVAAFMGAKTEPYTCTVWFHPTEHKEIADIRFEYDAENIWFNRIKDISRVAMERWEGLVQVGMTDLGGSLDVLSTFRPGKELLMDLYDYPDEVKRLTWDAHHLWWRYFDEINQVLQPTNPGYTAWAPIFSETPYYMLQCDFCYMISPDMFDEFVKPELAETCRRLGNPFYHLDGVGALSKLDSLLSIEALKGVQWVPGDGKPGLTEWPEVYREIRKAGKLIQLWGDSDTLDKVVEQLGSPEGIVILTSAHISQEEEAKAFLRKYGALKE
jgi:hypothetical protein